MIRRFFFALIFGTLIGVFASGQSGPSAGIMGGLLSACGFWVASSFLRARVLKRQGRVPAMQPGEEALLYGPCEVSDPAGKAKAWAYLSNQRLILCPEDGGPEVDMALGDIQELRPDKAGVGVVSKKHGLLRLKLPDAVRWLDALRKAVRN